MGRHRNDLLLALAVLALAAAVWLFTRPGDSGAWAVVTVDGVEQERTLLNKDTYNASKAIYRVGPALPAIVPPDPNMTAPVETAPVETAPATGVDGGPGVTQPAENPAPAAPADPAPAAPADPAPVAPAADPAPVVTPIPEAAG